MRNALTRKNPIDVVYLEALKRGLLVDAPIGAQNDIRNWCYIGHDDHGVAWFEHETTPSGHYMVMPPLEAPRDVAKDGATNLVNFPGLFHFDPAETDLPLPTHSADILPFVPKARTDDEGGM